jgi:hypothetical protein
LLGENSPKTPERLSPKKCKTASGIAKKNSPLEKDKFMLCMKRKELS